MASEAATRYAEGLFQLAQEENTLKQKKSQAEVLLDLYEQNPDLAAFFNAAAVTDEEKKQLIRTAFASMDREMIDFLQLLVDKRRIYFLRDILKNFLHKANDALGIREAIVYSARPLNPEDMEKIRKTLTEKTGKEIAAVNRTDRRLIAGFKIVMDNSVTDVSMKHQLDQMKESLLKGDRV